MIEFTDRQHVFLSRSLLLSVASVTTVSMAVLIGLPGEMGTPKAWASDAGGLVPVDPPGTRPTPRAAAPVIPDLSPIRISGPNDVTRFNTFLGTQFKEQVPGANVEISSRGVDDALAAVQNGDVDVAVSDRPLTEGEINQGLAAIPIGGTLAYVYNRSNPSDTTQPFLDFVEAPTNQATIQQALAQVPANVGGNPEETPSVDAEPVAPIAEPTDIAPESASSPSEKASPEGGTDATVPDAAPLPSNPSDVALAPAPSEGVVASEGTGRAFPWGWFLAPLLGVPLLLWLRRGQSSKDSSSVWSEPRPAPHSDVSSTVPSEPAASRLDTDSGVDVAQPPERRSSSTARNTSSPIKSSDSERVPGTASPRPVDPDDSESSGVGINPAIAATGLAAGAIGLAALNNDESSTTDNHKVTSADEQPNEEVDNQVTSADEQPNEKVDNQVTSADEQPNEEVDNQVTSADEQPNEEVDDHANDQGTNAVEPLTGGMDDSAEDQVTSTIEQPAVGMDDRAEDQITSAGEHPSAVEHPPVGVDDRAEHEVTGITSQPTGVMNDQAPQEIEAVQPAEVTDSSDQSEAVQPAEVTDSSDYDNAVQPELLTDIPNTNISASDSPSDQEAIPPIADEGGNDTTAHGLMGQTVSGETPTGVSSDSGAPDSTINAGLDSDDESIENIVSPDPMAESDADAGDRGMDSSVAIAATGLAAGAIGLAALNNNNNESPTTDDHEVTSTGDPVEPERLLDQRMNEVADSDLALSALNQPIQNWALSSPSPKRITVEWTMPEAQQQALFSPHGYQPQLKLYDVTAIDLERQPAHHTQVHPIPLDAFEGDAGVMSVDVPLGDRDYLAEIGYIEPRGDWTSLGRSLHTYVPSTVQEAEATSTTVPDPVEEVAIDSEMSHDPNKNQVIPMSQPDVVPNLANIEIEHFGNNPFVTVGWSVNRTVLDRIAQEDGQWPFIIRLQDTTDLELERQTAHFIRDYPWENDDGDKTNGYDHISFGDRHELELSVPRGDRNYVAELGFIKRNGQWYRLARSRNVRVPGSSQLSSVDRPMKIQGVDIYRSPSPSPSLLPEGGESKNQLNSIISPTPIHSSAQGKVCHQQLTIDSQTNTYVLDEQTLSDLQSFNQNTAALDPGFYLISIESGHFSTWTDTPDVPGEPLVMLRLYGGRFVNRKTNVETTSAWITLNGYNDVLSLDVLEPMTLSTLFFDTDKDTHSGQITLLILKDE